MLPSVAYLGSIILFSSAAAQNVWQVTVGDATGSVVYSPNNITAAVGDTVQFTFNPKNHTVTQSTFVNPCAQKAGGFDSGFNPVATGTSYDLPTFNITVNDTNPIWVYCRQGESTAASHCGKGMVFSVNAGADGTNNSFAAFQAAAKAVGASLSSSAPLSASSTAQASKGTATTTSSGSSSPSKTPNSALSLNMKGSLGGLLAAVAMMMTEHVI